MKNALILKSGFAFLVLAGALTPVSSFGFSGEGDMYDRLLARTELQWSTGTESGAQGPIREEGMPVNAHSPLIGVADMYYSLAKTQSRDAATTAYGSEGPIRTETMESSPSRSSGEGDMYDVLRVQFGR